MKKTIIFVLIAMMILTISLASCAEKPYNPIAPDSGKTLYETAKENPQEFIAASAKKVSEALDTVEIVKALKWNNKGKVNVQAKIEDVNLTLDLFADNGKYALIGSAPVPQAPGMKLSAGAYYVDNKLTLDLTPIFGEGGSCSITIDSFVKLLEDMLTAFGDNVAIAGVFDTLKGYISGNITEEIVKKAKEFANEIEAYLNTEVKEEKFVVNGETIDCIVLVEKVDKDSFFTIIEKAFTAFGLDKYFDMLEKFVSARSLRSPLDTVSSFGKSLIEKIKETVKSIDLTVTTYFSKDTLLPVYSTLDASMTAESEEDGDTSVTLKFISELPKNYSIYDDFKTTIELTANNDNETVKGTIDIIYDADNTDSKFGATLTVNVKEDENETTSFIAAFERNKENGDFKFSVAQNGDFESGLNSDPNIIELAGKLTYDEKKVSLSLSSVKKDNEVSPLALSVTFEKDCEFPSVPASEEITTGEQLQSFLGKIGALIGGAGSSEPNNVETSSEFAY